MAFEGPFQPKLFYDSVAQASFSMDSCTWHILFHTLRHLNSMDVAIIKDLLAFRLENMSWYCLVSISELKLTLIFLWVTCEAWSTAIRKEYSTRYDVCLCKSICHSQEGEEREGNKVTAQSWGDHHWRDIIMSTCKEKDLHHFFSFSQFKRKNNYWKQLNSKKSKGVDLLLLHANQVFHQIIRQEKGWN